MASPREVELFLRGCPRPRIEAWLAAVAGGLRVEWDRDGVVSYQTERGPAVLTLRMEDGPFDGLLLPWGGALWASEPDAARAAAKALGCVVRCEPGPEFPEVDRWADILFEVDGGAQGASAERLVPGDA